MMTRFCLSRAVLPIIACLPCFVAERSAIAADDQGRQLAAACASCHDLDGRDAGIPAVVGMNSASLVQAMLAYRSGERGSQIMRVIAAALSPDEITEVATFLAAERPTGARR